MNIWNHWTGEQLLFVPLIILAALMISMWLGGWVTVAVLRRASRAADSAKHADPDEPVADDVPAFETQGLTGGRWIGRLERLAVTLSIIAGFPAAVAVVVAVKGLGRFAEIRRSSDASEKFVIGTLTSLLVSAVVGAVALWLLMWLWPDLARNS